MGFSIELNSGISLLHLRLIDTEFYFDISTYFPGIPRQNPSATGNHAFFVINRTVVLLRLYNALHFETT